MYVNTGNGRLMREETIVGIFDMDTATMEPATKEFLSSSQREGRVVLTTYELPKSFILTVDDMVTLSQLSTSALAGRITAGAAREDDMPQ